ncbi:hypothetical protein ACF0H5_012751 [Mactra antiquata]
MLRILRRRLKYVVVAVIIFIMLIWLWNDISKSNETQVLDVSSKLEPTLTVIVQDFDPNVNSLYETVSSIAGNFTHITVLIISKDLPYPPVRIPKHDNVKFFILTTDVRNSLNVTRPELYVTSNFVLFIPDSAQLSTSFLRQFENFVASMDEQNNDIFAIPVGNSVLKCHGLIFTVRKWTLELGEVLNTNRCGYVSGNHGILLRTKQLYNFANPFLTPTFMSLYIQLSQKYMKVVISHEMMLSQLHSNSKLDPQLLWQQKQYYNQQLKSLYHKIGVKLVIRDKKHEDWYGCHKESNRCFDTIYNSMPEYLYHDRWTPPCCLKNLRTCAKYVFNILDKCKVRYWLEGGSLLGAVRYSDIIPWDYDIDIGIYEEDIVKCDPLAKMAQESYVDDEGYEWEKAFDGDYYHVQYSETNHLHVDIFPFYSKNGIMTKNTWFKTHKQDTEFPESFLKPLTRIKFAGMEVSAPNHVRDFLEYKFGKGVIESPKYPNAKLV